MMSSTFLFQLQEKQERSGTEKSRYPSSFGLMELHNQVPAVGSGIKMRFQKTPVIFPGGNAVSVPRDLEQDPAHEELITLLRK